MFFVPHLLAIIILLFVPAFERARQRARELRKPNQALEPIGFWASGLPLHFSVLMVSSPVAQLGR